MAFDEALLEDPDGLAARDAGLLRALASAGAQVRTSVARAAEFGIDRLRGETPRAVLVAADSAARSAARVAVTLGRVGAPTVAWDQVELPRWAGSADTLLVAAVEGHDPRLVALTDQAVRRGMGLVVVARSGSPVAQAAGRAPVAALADGDRRAARWAVLTPLVQTLEVLGLLRGARLADVADHLDAAAETYRPTSDAFTNPAKSLAVELSDAVGVLVAQSPLAACAAHDFVDALTRWAGVVAVSIEAPAGAAEAAGVLAVEPGPGRGDDFFRDRVDTQSPRPRLLLLDGEADADPRHPDPDQRAAALVASTLQTLAARAGIRSSHLDVPPGSALSRYAVAAAFGDFTSTYLALGLGRNLVASTADLP